MANQHGRTTSRRPTAAKSAKAPTARAPKKAHAPAPARTVEIDVVVVALVALSALVFLATWIDALGPVGRSLNAALALAFGWGRLLLAPAFIAAGVVLALPKLRASWRRLAIGGGLVLLGICGLCEVASSSPSLSAPSASLKDAGGLLGALTAGPLSHAIGAAGTVVVCLALLVAGVVVATGIGLVELSRLGLRGARAAAAGLSTMWSSNQPMVHPVTDEAAPVVPKAAPKPKARQAYDDGPDSSPAPAPAPASSHVPDEQGPEVVALGDAKGKAAPRRRSSKVTTVGSWQLPPLSLLSRSKEHRHDEKLIEDGGAALVAALNAHGVQTNLVGWTVGPTVTRYELELGAGVKVARVTSLHKDIAYAMASPDVRILAPIPGRSAIGIEVPNRQRQLVALGDILDSPEAESVHNALDVALGRDIAGRPVLANLAEFPHVLISGATGAGKSSAMNSLITSILMRSTPDQAQLILIDPKRVELGQYNGLPHLLAPVVVDPKKAANALNWAVKEMERRYDLLSEYGVRDITGFNELYDQGLLSSPRRPNDRARAAEVAAAAKLAAHGEGAVLEGIAEDDADDDQPKRMGYIAVIVDELNDLMMVAARDVEESIVRIAQMARAVGIHLVIATQRPSVDVITGVIKANIPSRMAFSVSSLADSRVILDQPGAERLVGKGDMLLLTASSNVARRIQSPWVSEDEVRSVVEFWQRQGGQGEQVVAVSGLDVDRPASGGSSAPGEDDELYVKAKVLVVESGTGSTSMLQRQLRVGFARAGRLMDMLERNGVVGPSDGSKTREVLMTPDQLDPLERVD